MCCCLVTSEHLLLRREVVELVHGGLLRLLIYNRFALVAELVLLIQILLVLRAVLLVLRVNRAQHVASLVVLVHTLHHVVVFLLGHGLL